MGDHQVEMQSVWQKVRPAVILTALYTFAQGFLLLNRGFYWDGVYYYTLLKEKNFEILWAGLSQARVYSFYYVLRFFSLLGAGVFTIKFIIFLSWLIAGIALWFVLKNWVKLREEHAFFIAAVFLLIPSFVVKVELSTSYYSLCNMFFFVGLLAYAVATRQGKTWIRIVGFSSALFLFFLSFFTNSFLVFYGGFLLFLLYKEYEKRKVPINFSFIFSWFKSHIIFVALPIAFWVFKLALGKPYGLAVHYNEFIFSSGNFFDSFILNSWNGIAYGIFWPLVAPLTILQRKIFAGLLIILIAVTWFLTRKILKEAKQISSPISDEVRSRSFVMWGLLFLALGLIPYILVGKGPHIFGFGFGMRHALLLPFGSALLILGTILGVVKERWQNRMQIFVLALFTVFTIYNYFLFDMDWYRQRAIVASLRDTPYQEIKDATTLVIHDTTGGYAYQARTIGGDEYRTYAHEAFGLTNFKFAVVGDEGTNNKKINDEYAQFINSYILPFPKDFNPAARPLKVTIFSRVTGDMMTVSEWLKLKRLELFFSKSTFEHRLKNDLQIEVIPS